MSTSPERATEPPVRFSEEPIKVERVAPSDLDSMRRLAELQLREVKMPPSDIEPPFISDREALVELYHRCLGAFSPSERRDRSIQPLLDEIARYLGVPDAE